MAGMVQADGGRNCIRFYPLISTFIAQRVQEYPLIPQDRRAGLNELASYVERRLDAGRRARLCFVCTHNSRRSQMAQVWAAATADYYGLPNVLSYSGGTESSAFNPRAVDALRRAGFEIDQTTDDLNPVYHVRYRRGGTVLTVFSKVYGAAPNPTAEFGAVMTCSQADEACPGVRGADSRHSIPYDDPKAFDGTDLETRMYDERCAQISRELLYAFSKVDVRLRANIKPEM